MNLINGKGSDETIFSNQEQIYDFYETLRNGSNESVDQFQSILEVFVADILKYRKEIKRLEDSYKRDKETNEKFLRNIEEDQERDMRQLEEKVRQEERQKFDLERELILQRTSREINELESNLQRLRTIEQVYTTRKTEEDSSTIVLREEIAKLTQENQTLNASLNDSLTANAILQSDLQSFRTQLNERQTMLLQEKQSASGTHRERDSLQTNVRHLVEVNKQLRDENDSLRAVIESNKTNTLTAPNTLGGPERQISVAGSTLGNYWNHSRLDSPSPSYLRTHQRKFDSFDLGSADEIGMLRLGSQSMENFKMNVASNKIPPLVAATTLSNIASENNTTNDSGLSLTTVRDPNEMESDHESRLNKEISMNNGKQYRPLMTTKKNNNETDSDDVFVEISLDRNQPKRVSQRRGLKRGASNAQSSKYSQDITQSPSLKRVDESTMSNIQQDLSFDRMFKVVFCGDAAVGKSTLIMRLCKGKFVSSVNSTLGVDFQNKQIEVDGKRVALQLWDTAGQERFRSIAKSYFRRCDGVILVYDATYERSFLNVREWLSTITDATPKKVSVMIVANKIDLRDQIRAEGKRVIEQNEGARLAKEHKALFIETSAKEGTNSNETLIELARDMQCNEDLERFRTAGIDLDKRTAKKSLCCGS